MEIKKEKELEKKPSTGTGKNIIIILLAVLFAGSIGFNAFQWNKDAKVITVYKTKVDSLYIQRDTLKTVLAQTSSELDKYKGINEQLDNLVNEGNAKIAQQEAKIQELMNINDQTVQGRAALKKEIAKLQKLKNEYIEKSDKLVSENKELKSKNEELSTTVTQLTEQKTDLENKITSASAIKADFLQIIALKKKSNGHYIETNKAKKVDKLSISFTILENQFAPAGETIAYVRIIGPDGQLFLTSNSGTFNRVDGSSEETKFTTFKKFPFNNARQEISFDFIETKYQYIKGNYRFEVWIDGKINTQAVLTLE